jgi:hypothetical protein
MSQFTRFVVLVMAILLIGPGSLFARSPQTASPEGQLFNSLNRERAALGLPVLKWDDALASAARQHAARMAQLDQMSHQLPGEPDLLARVSATGARFSAIAENVAVGPDPGVIHTMWMHSPGHRANILSPELSSVGIAVVQGDSGLFAVQDFARTIVNANLDQQAQEVISLLAARGLQANASENARASCDGGRSFEPSSAATLVRYETPNLDKLPDVLNQQLQSHRFRAATVAACTAGASSGFSRFRVAVLLF